MVQLATVSVLLGWLVAAGRARDLRDAPLKMSVVYYELEGKGVLPKSYKFKLNPIHSPAPCEDPHNPPNTCNVNFQFKRCSDAALNSSCTAESRLSGIPQSAFFTCDRRVKRYLNGLRKPVEGARDECLSTQLLGSGSHVHIYVFNGEAPLANATVPLGRGRSIAMADVVEKALGRHIKMMLYQDDVDEYYETQPST